MLVLDDYHLIENGEIHGAIALLVERLPAAAHLVISTRSDPPLPLSRLRARGQLTEIRGADLRFNVTEAGAFLNDVVGLDLEPDEIARLHERTEGWAAGLQLAGLSLRGREDHRQFIDSFAGDDQQIVDYLGFEVLDSEPAELREFMIQSSVLERLSGPLCAAVTGNPDAERLLRRLERDNAFVVALDSKREWYRYHHLFAELLRHELARAHPGLARRASPPRVGVVSRGRRDPRGDRARDGRRRLRRHDRADHDPLVRVPPARPSGDGGQLDRQAALGSRRPGPESLPDQGMARGEHRTARRGRPLDRSRRARGGRTAGGRGAAAARVGRSRACARSIAT